MRRWLMVLLAWVAIAPVARPAETMPPKPARYFNDYAHVVSPSTGDSLNAELENYERQTSNQVVVAIFPKMESDSSIEDYTQRVAENWQVGQAGKNNGVVLFIFTQEHKLYIQVGYGLEGALPDALAKRIIEDEITPRFKSGDFNGGVTAGVNAMLAAMKGEYKGTGKTVNQSRGGGGGSFDPTDIIFGIFFLILIFRIVARTRKTGTVYTRNGRRVYTSAPSLWWWGGGGGGWGGGGGGGSGGGFGGGGGFSGGGGSFGGGGAGGSW